MLKKWMAWIMILCLSAACSAEALIEGAGDNWLMIDAGGGWVKAGEVECPPDMAPLEDNSVIPLGPEPEFYFAPLDKDAPLRFLYYTTGNGEPAALADAALKSYASLYDTFEGSEPRMESLNGREWLVFDYVSSYDNEAGDGIVVEQSAVCYLPLTKDRFIVCIVSLAWDDAADRLNAEDLHAVIETAAAAVTLEPIG